MFLRDRSKVSKCKTRNRVPWKTTTKPENQNSLSRNSNNLQCRILAQSICTHYSCFENMGRFVTLKKIKSKIWTWKKQGEKNRVIVIQKEKKAECFFFFWIKITLFFVTCFFQVHILDLIFFRVTNRPMFSKQE